MPFIPHSDNDVKQMLQTIGVNSIEQLFDEIPADLRIAELKNIPEGLNEMEAGRLMQERAESDRAGLCFIGAGAYEHHIPAAVWSLVSRGEYLTAYTPYQAEASQGGLQLMYEYQTMLASLTGMEVSNASLYEGASALAEAVLMAVRANRRTQSMRILIPAALHPNYRRVVETIVGRQHIELVEIPYSTARGVTSLQTLQNYADDEFAAMIISQPNFFGTLEEVDALTDWAHQHKALVIGVVNPIALGCLREPGKWGQNGADIVCGEGQPLGVPLSSGGPYFGFLACKKEFVRQMPGRIVGRTTDLDGRPGFTLTLQAREQHIRRAKATSNICTNQGLLVTAATIYMSLLGPEGLRRVALSCHHNAQQLLQQLTEIPGVERVFSEAYFHECVVRLPKPVDEVLDQLAAVGIQGGYALAHDYPELQNCLLVCATETKTAEDLAYYAEQLRRILRENPPASLALGDPLFQRG